MIRQVSRENSFWMFTGVPAWALMRCRVGTGIQQVGGEKRMGKGGPPSMPPPSNCGI